MNTLTAMLKAYIDNALEIGAFSTQYINYWNDIRVEQNKAIETSGIRPQLDNLWSQYKSGDLDEVDYGMKWTEALSELEHVRIMPQSIVASLGNEVYNQLTLFDESDHIDTQEIPTEDIIRNYCQQLLDAIIT